MGNYDKYKEESFFQYLDASKKKNMSKFNEELISIADKLKS